MYTRIYMYAYIPYKHIFSILHTYAATEEVKSYTGGRAQMPLMGP